LIEDTDLRAAAIRCKLLYEEALLMKKHIDSGYWPLRDKNYLDLLDAIGVEEERRRGRPGVRLPEEEDLRRLD
jgi:hypothetical protein